jgi:hypothetical protein
MDNDTGRGDPPSNSSNAQATVGSPGGQKMVCVPHSRDLPLANNSALSTLRIVRSG